MAGFSYESRTKLTETMCKELAEKGVHLSELEKKMLPDRYYYSMPRDVCNEMRQHLRQSASGKLSDLYRSTFQNVVDVCVAQELQEEFYDALDAMNCYQMTAGWFRRSLRSGSYLPFVENSIQLLRAYAHLQFYGGDLAAVLTGKISEELYDHARNEFVYSWMLAAQIDRGEEKTIRAVKDILFGESNTLMMSRELVLGIVMSKSQELYQDLGKFLLAARLQEGARQVVCESMDAGRPEAFLHLFSVIEENDLIRYSSVKRAVSTWIGIFNEKSVDRISGKLLRMMGQCLRDKEYLNEQLASNDAIAISCALWAKGFYNADDAVETVTALIRNGTKQQKMTASYFCHSLQDEKQQMRAAKEVLLSCPEDLELVACFMPSFMPAGGRSFYELIRREDEYYYGFDDGEVREPKPLAPESLFQDSAEAEAVYGILKGILGRIPKKGLKLSPCIFPWHEVEMSPSDIAWRICVIAWMLQKEDYLDEAAELIPLVGQGQTYNASRAAAARVLLYRPTSIRRKKVLFELLHNAEEFTNRAAYKLAEDMELSAEDYIQIEQNLSYKKGRAGTLALLHRQDSDGLAECIRRLLAQKSEECHMGALDLALQLQKEDKATFETIIPALETLSNPTGKEQVLLKELLGKSSEAQDILKLPGYGLYDVEKEWIVPAVDVDERGAEKLFVCGEEMCIGVLNKLDRLIDENRERTYKTAWGEELMLGNGLEVIQWNYGDLERESLDNYPFRELWETFYEKEVQTPQLLLEMQLFCMCRGQKSDYERNAGLYQKVFGHVFSNLDVPLSYKGQVETAISLLFSQYVPRSLLVHFGLCGAAKLLSVLDSSNALFTVEEAHWNGQTHVITRRALDLPVFGDMCRWLFDVEEEDWERSFALRFGLQQYYHSLTEGEDQPQYGYYKGYYRNFRTYLELSDYVQCYIRGVWDKDLFYKAVFTFCDIGNLLDPVSVVEQRGAVPLRSAGSQGLNTFFGYNVIKPVDGKYHFDTIGDEMPEMVFAHELYRELIPIILKVELKRGEQPTPFSKYIKHIYAVYGIDYMIQILTALGKDPLQRGYSYYSSDEDRRHVLSHLLKVSMPKPEETAQDLKQALKGTDITQKRLVELAMYAQQWIPMIEEYLKMPGFASTCYYFMAHTSEEFDEQTTSVIAKYTPLSTEELRDGAFDIHWFFEAYEKLGEKNFKMLYDAAKYSSTGTAHGRARKYADAALGKVDKEALKAEINVKRNKDLLMSMGLLPFPKTWKAREEDLLERYQFIQKYNKESRQFGAQRRASEGRAVEIALRNLSVNAGFTDVTRLTLRMEGKLAEHSAEFFDWRTVGDMELMVLVDGDGKSALQCRKDGRLLKSVPAKHKKDETVLRYQAVVKKLKEQYSRTKQMMEQAMEDRTAFEVWEFLELYQNPIARPITEPLVVRTAGEQDMRIGFLTKDGIVDSSGTVFPVKPKEQIYIAHPFDLYSSGHWHEYQKLLFERHMKQPFKQVFRELYVKLEEELDGHQSMLFSGNQIQPQKTVGTLRGRRWVADYEGGLQKIYYKEDIVACIYAMADWFSPSDAEAPTLEYVVFTDRRTGKSLKIKEIPDIIYSEVMRDVDLAVSVAHAGGVDPETSHSTIEMRRAIVECNLALFQTKNVRLEGSHAIIDGKLGQYTVHLGSGVVHQIGNAMLFVVPVHAQQRGRIFLPFVDDDPKTAEIMSKILLFAEDAKIKDPKILGQIQ
ncbi:MAG: DUF4132 domain-containing protein [Lachnospiraceae bacterium]|nr:DUF4132 domain-containing protein [Lachnospiraceae bacterium]